MDNRTEQLPDGVWRVEVGYSINVVVLANDGHGDGLPIVDTGRRQDSPWLVRSVRMLGFDPLAMATAPGHHPSPRAPRLLMR
jgi:hypothetical protein